MLQQANAAASHSRCRVWRRQLSCTSLRWREGSRGSGSGRQAGGQSTPADPPAINLLHQSPSMSQRWSGGETWYGCSIVISLVGDSCPAHDSSAFTAAALVCTALL